MLIKTDEGIYKRIEEASEKDSYKIISSENTFIIKNFFNEEFLGVLDLDTVTFINTNIRFNSNN